jgi:hypothetical protein
MRIKKKYLVLIAVSAILITGVVAMSMLKIKSRIDSNSITLPTFDDVPKECWKKLAGKKIFFGHQSVGYNIMDRIADIINERDDIKLNVIESREVSVFDRPVFAHLQVGKNMDPVSKIKSFIDVMDSGVGAKVDIAFFKFCYVDIMRNSDPEKIFNLYSTALRELKERYPETKFLHVTVPLRSTPKGIERNLKQSIKLLIGKPGVLDDNIKRERYNELLTDAYSKTEPLFDLALIETVNPDGFRCYAVKGEEKVHVMASEYTEDGGHLNSRGSKKVAEQLLICLAEIANGL